MDKGKCFREKFSLKQSLKQKVFTLLAWQTPLLLCPNDYCLLPSKWIFFFCYFITSPSIYISCLLVHTLLYNNEQQKDSTERTAHHLQILYFDLIVVDSMYGKKNAYGYLVTEEKTLAEMAKYSLEMYAPTFILWCCHGQATVCPLPIFELGWFFCYWVVWVIYIFLDINHLYILFANIFFSFCRLSFHFVDGFFYYLETFKFDVLPLVYLFFILLLVL